MSCKSSSVSVVLVVVSHFAVSTPPANAQTIQWTRQFGTASVDEAFAVATAPDGVYVAGETINGSFTDSAKRTLS